MRHIGWFVLCINLAPHLHFLKTAAGAAGMKIKKLVILQKCDVVSMSCHESVHVKVRLAYAYSAQRIDGTEYAYDGQVEYARMIKNVDVDEEMKL